MRKNVITLGGEKVVNLNDASGGHERKAKAFTGNALEW